MERSIHFTQFERHAVGYKKKHEANVNDEDLVLQTKLLLEINDVLRYVKE